MTHHDVPRWGTTGSEPSDLTSWRARRLTQLSADIGARLSRVCGHLPDDEFTKLVRDIADMSLRFEQRDNPPSLSARAD
jgi:hypothetical protein